MRVEELENVNALYSSRKRPTGRKGTIEGYAHRWFAWVRLDGEPPAASLALIPGCQLRMIR